MKIKLENISETFVKELIKEPNIKEAFIREGIIEETKQTAVEWLVEKLKQQGLLIGEPDNLVAVRKANKMFEQQIIESGNSCAFKQRLHSDRINKMSIDELEQYDLEPSYTFGEEHYYETFKK